MSDYLGTDWTEEAFDELERQRAEADSPRWCDLCKGYGHHHADRCPYFKVVRFVEAPPEDPGLDF